MALSLDQILQLYNVMTNCVFGHERIPETQLRKPPSSSSKRRRQVVVVKSCAAKILAQFEECRFSVSVLEVKTSWGASWGMAGYVNIFRGKKGP
eukprot:4926488-Amphidinium_carterae.3